MEEDFCQKSYNSEVQSFINETLSNMPKLTTIEKYNIILANLKKVLDKDPSKKIVDIINTVYLYTVCIPMPIKFNCIEFKYIGPNVRGSVFATDNIPANMLITYFPANAMILDGVPCICRSGKSDTEFKTNIENNSYGTIYSTGDIIHQNHRIRIIGDPDYNSNLFGLGHLISDPIPNPFIDDDYECVINPDLLKNKINNYYEKGFLLRNCKFVVMDSYPVICVVSTKDISLGEELNILYGHAYWYENYYNEDIKPVIDNYIEMDPIFAKQLISNMKNI